MAIYKLRVCRRRDGKLHCGYSVSNRPYQIGGFYEDRLREFGGGWFQVLEILDVIPQKKDCRQ